VAIKHGLDLSIKQVGKTYRCLWHGHNDVEMKVTERFDAKEYNHLLDEAFEPEEQVWVSRLDGKPFERTAGNETRRFNNTEELLNEAWLTPILGGWDPEENDE